MDNSNFYSGLFIAKNFECLLYKEKRYIEKVMNDLDVLDWVTEEKLDQFVRYREKFTWTKAGISFLEMFHPTTIQILLS